MLILLSIVFPNVFLLPSDKSYSGWLFLYLVSNHSGWNNFLYTNFSRTYVPKFIFNFPKISWYNIQLWVNIFIIYPLFMKMSSLYTFFKLIWSYKICLDENIRVWILKIFQRTLETFLSLSTTSTLVRLSATMLSFLLIFLIPKLYLCDNNVRRWFLLLPYL